MLNKKKSLFITAYLMLAISSVNANTFLNIAEVATAILRGFTSFKEHETNKNHREGKPYYTKFHCANSLMRLTNDILRLSNHWGDYCPYDAGWIA